MVLSVNFTESLMYLTVSEGFVVQLFFNELGRGV